MFTTASQPVLEWSDRREQNPKADFKGIEHIKEIIPEEFVCDQLHRVKLSIDDTGKTYDEIAAKVSEYNKVLCIVNTHAKMPKSCMTVCPMTGVKLHLSRMMCPAHLHRNYW